jgi:hypothetical protein
VGLAVVLAGVLRRLLADIWMPEQTSAFNDIVGAISTATTLSHPDDTLPMS